MYNVTIWRVWESLLLWKSNMRYIFVCAYARVRVPRRVGVCAYSLAYPARNAYAPYCDVICGPSVFTIFFGITSKTARFSEKRLLNIKCVFWFSPQICLKHFLLQEEFSEILSKMSKRLHVKYSLFLCWYFHGDEILWSFAGQQPCQCITMHRRFDDNLMKLESSRRIFEKRKPRYQV